ncbi:MAG TPA: FmdB family zinc ribbon protein, partial [Herpetosiphonaceae bacterium]
MPTYVYACGTCGAQFEQFQRFSDEPLTECPRCQGLLKRVFQPVGIVFKGSGWYVTDSRNASSSTTPAAGSPQGAGGEAGKPADKPADKPAAEPAADSSAKAEPAGSPA